MRKIITAAAAACLILLVPAIAMAQIAPSTNTIVDLSPIANTLIAAAASVLSVAVPTVLWYWWRILARRWGIEELKLEESLRATIDEGIAKGIGLAKARAERLGEDVLKVDVKSELVASIAGTVIKNFPDTAKKLGVTEAKMIEMVQSRLGIMQIQAETGITPPGLPVPPTPAPAVTAEK